MTVATNLGIFNPARLIDNMLKQAPRGMMVREMLVNSKEAEAEPAEHGLRTISIISDEGKLVIINSGKGMDAEQLETICQLASSGDYKDEEQNRGEGGKVASLKFNPLGLRYRSRKDGVLSQVTIQQINGIWQVIPATPTTLAVVGGAPNSATITPVEQARYSAFVGDFTEVKMLGMSPGHQTAFSPYDDQDPDHFLQAVPREIFNRFYDFSQGRGIDMIFDSEFSRDRARGKRRRFRTISEIIDDFPHEFEHVRPHDRFVTLPNGVKIEYLKYKSGLSRNPFSNFIGRNNGIAGIVLDGEMYDVISDRWPYQANKFGMTGMGSEVSIFVHLPKDYGAEPDRYRERLLDRAGRAMVLDDFLQDIVDNRPQWLMTIIASRLAPKRTSRQAQNRLAEFAQKMFAKMANGQGLLVGGAAPSGTTAKTKKTKTKKTPATPGKGKGNGSNGNVRNNSSSNKPGFHGRIPTGEWVDHTNCMMFGLPKDRAVTYNRTTGQYIMNRDYFVYKEILNEILEELILWRPGVRNNLAMATKLVKDLIDEKILYKVGVAIVRQEAKERMFSFTAKEIADSLSLEALSIAFDLAILDVAMLVRDAKRIGPISVM